MKNQHCSEKHQFAFYVHNLSDLITANGVHQSLILTDSDLVHRIHSVLRLEPGQPVLLFDQKMQCAATIMDITKKKSVRVIVLQIKKNVVLQPTILFGLPVLKRDALEAALYSLAEIGVNQIQLIYTSKSQKQWSAKDHERAQKIIIAAAEQSKNFAFPTLLSPVPLSEFIATRTDTKNIAFILDIQGKSLVSFLERKKDTVMADVSSEIILIIGPEGGLTNEEKSSMENMPNIHLASLTPTVLRASQAAAVSAALVRSILCTNHNDLFLDLDECS